MITRLIFLLCIQILFSQDFETPNSSPIHVLSKITKKDEVIVPSNSFDQEWVKDLKLLLPCKNVDLSWWSSCRYKQR